MEVELRPELRPRRLSEEIDTLRQRGFSPEQIIDTLRQRGFSREQIMDELRKSGFTSKELAQGPTPGKVPIEPGLVGRQPRSGLTEDFRRIGKDTGEPRPEWLQKIIDEFTKPIKVPEKELDKVQPEHKLKPLYKPSPKELEANTVPLSVSTVRHRFLSFNPFEGVDTDLSPKEEARLFTEAATLKRLAGHFAQQTGEIKSLLNKAKAHPEKEQYYTREAADLSCTTLQEVSKARHLREGIRLLARTRNHHLDVDAIVSVLTYIEDFFEEERRLLVRLGTPGDLATEIIADCRKVFEDVRNGQAPRGQVFEAITRVTEATCDLAKRLREQQAIQDRERERTKEIVIRAASQAIGGTAVVVLNARIYATPGLQAVAAFSGELGAGLILLAVQDLWTLAK